MAGIPTEMSTKTSKSPGISGKVLSQRALNRALLERQMLSRRYAVSVENALERVVGLQAQAPIPPYFGLWSRLEGFQPGDLVELLNKRRVVRAWLMRGTIHLVTAHDCLRLSPLVRPVLDRLLYNNPARRDIADMDLNELVATGCSLLEEKPRTAAELRELLHERWPARDAGALASSLLFLTSLVQTPPRGIWGVGGKPTVTTAESWLGQPLASNPSKEDLVTRYLSAFGPATVNDVQSWSGLTRLGEIVERLRPRLRTFRDERGRELFDLPDAPLPDPKTPVPVRFVAEFDNLILSHADRSRIVPEEHRRQIATLNGMVPGTVLVDGFVRGSWKITKSRKSATLLIKPYEEIAKPDRAALEEEGARLLTFAAPDVAHELQFAD
jgi:DNA glycosylase AlkZ-like